MKSLTIENVSQSSEDQRQKIAATILANLIAFNLSHVAGAHIEPVILAVKDESQLVGGLIGRIAFDWLHIDLLWLDESIRNNNVGKKLLLEAETIALRQGCVGVHLDTFSFQAPGFYQKLGYEVFGEIENHPQGQSRYFLKKSFK